MTNTSNFHKKFMEYLRDGNLPKLEKLLDLGYPLHTWAVLTVSSYSSQNILSLFRKHLAYRGNYDVQVTNLFAAYDHIRITSLAPEHKP